MVGGLVQTFPKKNETPYFRIGMINRLPYGPHSLTAAAKHNKREISSRQCSFDPSLSHLNRFLCDSPDDAATVVALAEQLMADRGYTPKRTDGVIAAEGMFSLRHGAMDEGLMLRYFEACAAWLVSELGGTLLDATVHRDEEHPHCHVLVLLPLEEDGTGGRDFIGFTRNSQQRNIRFFEQVAQPFGLSLPPPMLTVPQRKVLAREVHRCIADDPELIPVLWPVLARAIDKDPREAASLLGVKLTGNHAIAVLAASAGHGLGKMVEAASDWRGDPGRNSAPVAVASFLSSSDQPEVRPEARPAGGASCVAVASFLSSSTPAAPQLTVERDSDRTATDWDGEIGEWRPHPPPRERSQRAAADAQVAALLKARAVPAEARQ